MATFREIPEEAYAEAAEVMRYAGGTGPRPAIDVMPGFENMVAGTAIALAEGAPYLFERNSASGPAAYLDPTSKRGAHMHAAVARVIEIRSREPDAFPTADSVLYHMAGDAAVQADARGLEQGIANYDPDNRAGQPEARHAVIEVLLRDPGIYMTLKHRASGAYHKLDPWDQEDAGARIARGDLVPREVKSCLDILASSIDQDRELWRSRDRAIDSTLGDHRDFKNPLFRPWDARIAPRVEALIKNGKSTGNAVADLAIMAHSIVHSSDSAPEPSVIGGVTTRDPRALIARTRLLSDLESGRSLSVDEAVVRIEADRLVMAVGSRATAGPMEGAIVPYNLARGLYERLPSGEQETVYRTMESGDIVAPIDRVRLAFVARVIENGRDKGTDSPDIERERIGSPRLERSLQGLAAVRANEARRRAANHPRSFG